MILPDADCTGRKTWHGHLAHARHGEKIEFDPKTRPPWDEAVVKAFRRRMNFIRQAHNELDLYAWKSLRIEKLRGNRQRQCSMRLNNQWRLIFEIEGAGPDRFVAIVSIEDYH